MDNQNYKKINNYLNHWLKSNGFGFGAKLDTYFYADIDECCVAYTLTDTDYIGQRAFINSMRKGGLELDFDYFICAFFHELGHLNTSFYLTDNDWELWEDILNDTTVGNDVYFETKCEKLATDWAITYINNHKDIVKDFANSINKLNKGEWSN